MVVVVLFSCLLFLAIDLHFKNVGIGTCDRSNGDLAAGMLSP